MQQNENDFIVAIQAILEQARDSGWPVGKVIDKAYEAISEFEDEHIGEDDAP